MDPVMWIKEVAKDWVDVVALVGVVLLFWYVVETYRIRLATITQGAPYVRLGIDYNRARFTVRNLEGRTAYNIQCDPFVGTIIYEDDAGVRGPRQVRCMFEPVDLTVNNSTELDAYMESGHRTLGAGALLEALRSSSGLLIGLPLQVRYHDGMGFRYAVRVQMPGRMYLDFQTQPRCLPPTPLTLAGTLKAHAVWRLAGLLTRARIRYGHWREARAEQRPRG